MTRVAARSAVISAAPGAAETAQPALFRCGLAGGTPAHQPMALLGGGAYHRHVVGGSGAGAGRSTAIVLFTDLVGSTELRSRLGDEAAEELRRKHDDLVVHAIETNRGRVVKNLGDGVMATFSGASDAMAAAVAIQQSLDRHNRSGGG